MLMKLYGFRHLDFTTADGSLVKGTQLFTGNPEDGVTGEITDRLFVKDGKELPTLTPGMTLDVTFTRKGKVDTVKAAPVAKG